MCGAFLVHGSAVKRVVIKLGGSLLLRPGFPDRLRRVIGLLDAQHVLIVVGGGAAADVVRDWSRIHELNDDAAHWTALRSLSVTRCLLLQLMPEFREASSFEAADAFLSTQRSPIVMDAESLLAKAEQSNARSLPHTWDVTSDSIAAWVASHWPAEDLVLLKSVDREPGMDIAAAQSRGLVDEYFDQLAHQVTRIWWCNLIAEEVRVHQWLTGTKR